LPRTRTAARPRRRRANPPCSLSSSPQLHTFGGSLREFITAMEEAQSNAVYGVVTHRFHETCRLHEVNANEQSDLFAQFPVEIAGPLSFDPADAAVRDAPTGLLSDTADVRALVIIAYIAAAICARTSTGGRWTASSPTRFKNTNQPPKQ
jgi:hypothetical protein